MDQQSHDHNNQPEKPGSDDGSGSGVAVRSYDCTFCKRGFTNAQALGGHMNIHRKDKAKAKKKTHDEDPVSSSPSPDKIAAAGYNYLQDINLGGRHVNYQVYMPPPNPAGLQTGNYEYPVWRSDNLQDRMDGNLIADQEEVDLELRLGRLL